MKILMIAPEPFFSQRGTPFSILGRLTALSRLSHTVDLVTYHVGETPEIPNVAIVRTPAIPFMKHVPVGPSIRKVFLDILLMAKAGFMLLRTSYDAVHSHEEASFFGLTLARVFRIPHIYDMHSSLPEQMVNYGYGRSSPVVRVFGWLERRVIRGSQVIITVCPALEARAREINGRAPCVIIENVPLTSDAGAVSGAAMAHFRSTHSLQGERIVLYTGTFEPYQGLDLLIDSALTVLTAHGDVVFVLLGGEADHIQRLRHRVKALGLEGAFRFLGTRSTAETQVATQAAHILVSPRRRGINTPLKIYTYLQAGKPIVATNVEAHTQVLDSEVAVLVDPRPEALARGICRLLEDSALADRLGIRARLCFERRYSVHGCIEETANALRLLTAARDACGV